MSFLDQIGKSISHGVDRAKFEADKFQRTNRLQSELNDIKKRLDKTLIDMGQRAYDLHRAGQINAPTIGAMAQTVDKLRSEMVIKEEALKTVQAEVYEEPLGTITAPAQPVPIVQEAPPRHHAASGTTTCTDGICTTTRSDSATCAAISGDQDLPAMSFSNADAGRVLSELRLSDWAVILPITDQGALVCLSERRMEVACVAQLCARSVSRLEPGLRYHGTP